MNKAYRWESPTCMSTDLGMFQYEQGEGTCLGMVEKEHGHVNWNHVKMALKVMLRDLSCLIDSMGLHKKQIWSVVIYKECRGVIVNAQRSHGAKDKERNWFNTEWGIKCAEGGVVAGVKLQGSRRILQSHREFRKDRTRNTYLTVVNTENIMKTRQVLRTERQSQWNLKTKTTIKRKETEKDPSEVFGSRMDRNMKYPLNMDSQKPRKGEDEEIQCGKQRRKFNKVETISCFLILGCHS